MSKASSNAIERRKGRQKLGDVSPAEYPHIIEIAQIQISLLHDWVLDPDLDRVCESKLGLLRRMVSV